MLSPITALLLSASAMSMTRVPYKVFRPTRLPVWPAWQGVALGLLSQLPGPFRGWADQLEDTFGGRVAPIQFDPVEADPFILLVHHRHAFRPLDFLRPLFSAVILPEGFPAHPHRGFETVTYVLPGRAGLTHRDSEGCKMRYGDGAFQWMTAGRGMLHEEMWDVDAGVDAELYQIWVNLPPSAKMVPPRVQLLEPTEPTPKASQPAEVIREGATTVRRAPIDFQRLAGGAVSVRTLADRSGGAGAQTYSPMTLLHVELNGAGAMHSVEVPEGWTCLVYVRRGAVGFGSSEVVASMHEMAVLARHGGESVTLTNAAGGGALTDVLVLAGEPIGAPVVASGTMVMNSDVQVRQAMADYQRGDFGIPWEHTLADDAWAALCDQRAASRGRQRPSPSESFPP